MGRRTLLLLIGVISLLVFLESSIPYIYAEKKAGKDAVFLGQIIFTPDQNMYFSFIRQARDGQFIMNNKLTSIPNKPVFLNLEFWVVGFLQHITGLSENGVYQLWRLLGIGLLAIGFYMLACIVLPDRRRILPALATFLFTGGFGFVFILLNYAHIISLDTAHEGMLDMRYGFMPFMQLMVNPHFSFPHGLILIAYAFFLMGERSNKLRDYILSGVFFNIIALVRPYDTLPPFIIFPLFIYLANRGQQFDFRSLTKRFLPLLMVIPAFLYNLWLFKVNDIFKYWSLQGHNAGSMPAMPWHYISYGIIGILAIVRLLQVKTNPLGRYGQFMLVWFAVTFVFVHLGKYFPVIGWSPQIGVYLAVPLTLLTFSLKFPPQTTSRWYYKAAVATVVLIVVISNAAIVLYYTKNFDDKKKAELFYASKSEMQAMQWLNKNAQKGDVVLATLTTSQRIAKYTSASVVAAHYSVTPLFAETATAVGGLFADTLLGIRQKPVLEQYRVAYVYVGVVERSVSNIKMEQSPYLNPVYTNPEVAIYKVNDVAQGR